MPVFKFDGRGSHNRAPIDYSKVDPRILRAALSGEYDAHPEPPPLGSHDCGGGQSAAWELAWRHASDGRAVRVCSGCGAKHFKVDTASDFAPSHDGHAPWVEPELRKVAGPVKPVAPEPPRVD